MRCNFHALRTVLPALLAGALFFACTPDFNNPLDPENSGYTSNPLPSSPWVSRAPMATARTLLACAAVNGKIYAFGGVISAASSGYLTDAVEEFDPVANHWAAKSPMPTARSEAAVAEVSGAVYLFGGDNGYWTVDKYVPASDSWPPESLATDPVGRQGAAACPLNGKIYVIGGLNGNCLADVREFDPGPPSAWTARDTMSEGRTGLAACAVNGKIYAIGGENSYGLYLRTVEVYDPLSDSWEIKKSMPTPRRAVAAAVVNNRIYVFGGYDGTVLDRVEVYDPSSDTWATLQPMKAPRCAMGCAVVNGRIYLIGGWADAYLNTVEEYNPE